MRLYTVQGMECSLPYPNFYMPAIALKILRQSIPRKASAFMNFIDEDSFSYSWIPIHQRPDFIYAGIEDTNSAYFAPFRNWADNRSNTIFPERKIPSTMFPEDLLNARQIPIGPSLQNYDGISLGPGDHLAHKIIGNCRHRLNL